MFFLAKRYPVYEAPLAGAAAVPPMKQYLPDKLSASSQKLFEIMDGETEEGYKRFEKTSVKFFEMFRWLYEYLGKEDTQKKNPSYNNDLDLTYDKDGTLKPGGADLTYGALLDGTGQIDDNDYHVRNFRGKDLLANAKLKGYTNLDGSEIRLNGDGLTLDWTPSNPDNKILDPQDPFGMPNVVREGRARSLKDGLQYVFNHPHFSRVVSIGGGNTGLPMVPFDPANIAQTPLIADSNIPTKPAFFTGTDEEWKHIYRSNIINSVTGFHMSSFEAQSRFPLLTLYNIVKDTNEIIPLVHPTDANFIEEITSGLFLNDSWKGSDGIQKYDRMPLFSSLNYGARSTGIFGDEPENNYLNYQSDFIDSNGEADQGTVVYNPHYGDDVAANLRSMGADLGIPYSIIDDSIDFSAIKHDYDDALSCLVSDTPAVIPDTNIFSYLNGVSDALGVLQTTYGQNMNALRTINFSLKLFYSSILIESGMLDLIGPVPWVTTKGNYQELSEFQTNNKNRIDSWSKTASRAMNAFGQMNLSEGVNSYHMTIMSMLTTYMHPISRAMASAARATSQAPFPYADAAHNDMFVPIFDANGMMQLKAFGNLRTSAHNNIKTMLNTLASQYGDGVIKTKITKMVSKLVDLNSNYSTQLSKLENKYAFIYKGLWGDESAGVVDSQKITAGLGMQDYSSDESSQFYYSNRQAPTRHWYATTYEYLRGEGTKVFWNSLQVSRAQGFYAKAKAEYKSAKKQTEAMEEAEQQRDIAYAEKRYSEAKAANQAADARRRSREAELKNMAAKNRKRG